MNSVSPFSEKAYAAGKQMRDEYIELRGLRFHYRDWASTRTDAPTLVLLHGYTGHARSWDYFAAAMTDRYRVIALDQRGHGETGWPPADRYGTDEMVADLRAFVAALGLQAFHLLGLSMGGIVAYHYSGGIGASVAPAAATDADAATPAAHADATAGAPPELARLVIVDIGPELIASGAGRIQDGAQSNDVFASKALAFAQQRASNARAPDAHLRYRVENNLMQLADGQWTWRYDRALRDPRNLRLRDAQTGWRAVAAIKVPTLVIRGTESDILAPEIAQRMVREIADAQLVEVQGSGHSVPLDAPDAFAVAARGFLLG